MNTTLPIDFTPIAGRHYPFPEPVAETITEVDNTKVCLWLLKNNCQFKMKLTIDEAVEVIKQFEAYNNIPSNLLNLIFDLKVRIGKNNYPTCNGTYNQNNNHYNFELTIGNESSLVIYVNVSTVYQVVDRAKIAVALKEIGEKYDADENDITTSNPHSIRARYWWD